MSSPEPRLRVATYNVHDCIGRDRRYDPERIVRILLQLNVDLVALQEVTLDTTGELLDLLQRKTGMQAIDGSLFERGVGRYGNLLLTRLPVLQTRLHDLSRPGREARGSIEALVDSELGLITVFATHLGLRRRERTWQIAALARALAQGERSALLMGDLNLWRGGMLAPLTRQGFAQRPVPSFPTWPTPIGALDRIMARTPLHIRHCWRHTGMDTRIASDHFPVIAEISMRPDGTEPSVQHHSR